MFPTGNLAGNPAARLDFSRIESATDLGFYSLINIAQAIGELQIAEELFLDVLTSNLQSVTGRETLAPEKALVLGPVKIIPQEYPKLKLRSIDIEIPTPGSVAVGPLIKNLLAELAARSQEPVVAWRDNERWTPTFEPVKLKKPPEKSLRLRQNGVYLITGGLGGVGLTLAKYLAQSVGAKLILTGRSPLPDRTGWGQWLQDHPTRDKVSQKIWKVKELEELGGTVSAINVDVADLEGMRKALKLITAEFGKVDGVFHCAGVADGGMIQLRTRQTTDPVLAPKVKGTAVIDELFQDAPLDFFIICSSLGSIIPTFGQVGYSSANSFLDAYAHYKSQRDGTFTVSINWDNWQEVGMAVAAAQGAAVSNANALVAAGAGAESSPGNNPGHEAMLAAGILPVEGIEVAQRILDMDNLKISQVIVSTGPLAERYRQWTSLDLQTIQAGLGNEAPGSRYTRPDLPNPYVAPRTGIEAKLVEVWQDILGIEGIGIDDNFFDLGGHSLKAAALNSSLFQRFQLEIPLRQIFITPTIAGLGEFIAAGIGNDTPETRSMTDNKSITPSPEIKPKEIEPLSDEEKRRILIDFNNTQREYPAGKLIQNLFEEQVERTPDRVALIFETIEVTYRELNHRANQLARSLRGKGVKPDQITGIMAERSLEILTGLLGILKAGGAYLPVDPESPEEKIRYMLEDSNTRILLTQRRLLSKVEFQGELINLDSETIYQGDGSNLENVNASSNTACVIYTPGSTGELNGVMIEHRAVTNFIHCLSERIPFGSRKTSLCLTGFSSDRFFVETLLPLANGLRIVMASEYQQKTLWLINTLIIDYQVEMMLVTPSRMQQLVSDPDFGISCMPFLREIFLGGDTWPVSFLQLEKPTQTRIYYAYSSPETTVWLTLRETVPGDPGVYR